MALLELLSALGDEIEDPLEETFSLFSQPIPSQNLGFLDAKAQTLQLTVAGRDLTLYQSPTLLSTNRAGGTTGAVAWKITPLVAEWLCRQGNWLFENNVIGPNSSILELGCGVSGIVASSLAPRVGKYVCTDQEYVFKLLEQNLQENATVPVSWQRQRDQQQRKPRHPKTKATKSSSKESSIKVLALDWERDDVSELSRLLRSEDHLRNGSVDVIIACDCIYNEALVEPFVSTCADLCKLRSNGAADPAICIVAQQLRSDSVFSEWLSAFCQRFRVWQVPDTLLTDELKAGRGFVIHLGILKEE